MSAHKITDREPELPCWLWRTDSHNWTRSSEWSITVITTAIKAGRITHWHPDQPTAPTCVQGEHLPDCDTNDRNLEGIRKPCNCAQPTPEAVPIWAKEAAKAVRGMTDLDWSASIIAHRARHAPPPVGEVTDSAMLQWADENVTRVICYTEPENNGDWWRVEYWHRRLDGKKHQHVTGPDFRNTLLAAMRSGREGEKS